MSYEIQYCPHPYTITLSSALMREIRFAPIRDLREKLEALLVCLEDEAAVLQR